MRHFDTVLKQSTTVTLLDQNYLPCISNFVKILKKLSMKCTGKKIFQWFQIAAHNLWILEISDYSMVICCNKWFRSQICSPPLQARPCAKSLKPPERHCFPSVLSPTAVNKPWIPSAGVVLQHFWKYPQEWYPVSFLWAAGGGIIRGGCFSCWCCPFQREGWLMPLCLPFPGSLTLTRALALLHSLPSGQASWGWRKSAGAGWATQNSVDLKYVLQLIAFPVWAVRMEAAGPAPAGSQAQTETAWRKRGKRKHPAAPIAPAASVPSLPHFLT